MRFDDYERRLFEKRDVHRKQMTFKSNLHEVNTIETNKKALNSIDDKGFVCDNQTDTLALGHYNLN